MKVLFVCTGNTCRSPMAEALLNNMNIPGVSASSAGTSATDGHPASENAVRVMADTNIDISSHKARRVTDDILRDADAVIAMTETHKDFLTMTYPQYKAKYFVLGNGISDPYGGDVVVYENCAAEIKDALEKTFGDLKK